jgi:multisubunit Na+/H+ antiporter MnhG subunit
MIDWILLRCVGGLIFMIVGGFVVFFGAMGLLIDQPTYNLVVSGAALLGLGYMLAASAVASMRHNNNANPSS